MPTSVSKCGRFVVIDQLRLDRNVFDVLAGWAAAVLDLLRLLNQSHVRAAIGREAELGYLHDRR